MHNHLEFPQDPLGHLLIRVRAERARQDTLHPRDDWPMTNPPHDGSTQETREAYLANLQQAVSEAERAGTVTWDDLLSEELAEAACALTPADQVRELVELAALALRAAEALNRTQEDEQA